MEVHAGSDSNVLDGSGLSCTCWCLVYLGVTLSLPMFPWHHFCMHGSLALFFSVVYVFPVVPASDSGLSPFFHLLISVFCVNTVAVFTDFTRQYHDPHIQSQLVEVWVHNQALPLSYGTRSTN